MILIIFLTLLATMINLIKFIHLLCTLSLLGGTLFCFATAGKYKSIASPLFHKIILYTCIAALLTGTLLVYPKHFTFHTPWIQAAYLLVFLYATIIILLNKFRDSSIYQYRIPILGTYFSLIILLILVIHDAVTKITFLF
jgi:cytochrome bd-type quinol oxidase subunit 2